jgi:hypothetical protein
LAENVNQYADASAQQAARIAQLEAKLGQYGERMQQTQQDSFMAAVSDKVPDWQVIQQQAIADGRMDQRMKGAPWTYNDALQEAQRRGDHLAAIEIFESWKEAPSASENGNQQTKGEHIVPDGNRGGTPSGQHVKREKKVTTEQLAKLSAEVTKNPSDRKLAQKFQALYDRFINEKESGR